MAVASKVNTMQLDFDHIVIGCLELEAGIAVLSEQLGAEPAGRGVHKMMGTHNALWNMGDAYIELVAIDPAATHPGRPRWFGLDDPAVQARLNAGPRLLTWAVSGEPAEGVATRAPMAMGAMELFSRDDLEWRVAVPVAGTSGMDGLFPLTIEWLAGLHPAKRLGDQGLRCTAMTLSHPDIDVLSKALVQIPDGISLAKGAVQIDCVIATPNGPSRLTAFD